MSTISDYEQNQMDAQAGREMDSHAESLKQWLEAGCCPKCREHYVLHINFKNIKFDCPCGWFAIYPIATIGNGTLEAENAALREEVAALKKHVEDLNHDFAASLAHCDRFHIEGREE